MQVLSSSYFGGHVLHSGSLLIIVAALIVGCSLSPGQDLGSTAAFIEDIEEMRVLWDDADITSYQVRYDRLVNGELYQGVTITVENDEIVESRLNSAPVTEPNVALTFDDMYEEMIDIVETEGRGSFSYRFNDNLSHPDFYRVSESRSLGATGVEISSVIIPDESM